MGIFKNLIRGLRDLIYPETCLVCKARLDIATIEELVCLDCWTKIKRNLPPFCRRCGRHLEGDSLAKGICAGCIRRPLYFDRAYSPCIYEGVIKELIQEFKYNGKDYLGRVLGRLLVEFIGEYSLPIEVVDWIVPIPLHTVRLREREFNQANILGQYIAKACNKRILDNALVRNRHTKPQAELEGRERRENVKGIFSVKEKTSVKGRNVLLVDDVLTTGATSSEAACVLKEAGAQIVFALTLAN